MGQPRDRRGRLRLVHDACHHMERHIITLTGPVQQRIPAFGLAGHQFGRAVGAITQQFGFAILRKAGGKGGVFGCHAIKGGIGKPGQRHGLRQNIVGLCAPFRGHRFGQLHIGQPQWRAGGCFHRAAIQQDAAIIRHRDMRVKSLHSEGDLHRRLSQTGKV